MLCDVPCPLWWSDTAGWAYAPFSTGCFLLFQWFIIAPVASLTHATFHVFLSVPLCSAAGPYGINHGVEQHADVVEYARERLELFKKTCEAFDEFEFCEPQFVVSDTCSLRPSVVTGDGIQDHF